MRLADSHILEALETGRTYRGHFNVKNGGTITNLPADCIIESPGFVDRFGINMVEGVTLPLACAATCSASVNVQRMSVQAAVTGDGIRGRRQTIRSPAGILPSSIPSLPRAITASSRAAAARRRPVARRAPQTHGAVRSAGTGRRANIWKRSPAANIWPTCFASDRAIDPSATIDSAASSIRRYRLISASAARTSPTNRSGCSQAAKCPPRGSAFQ